MNALGLTTLIPAGDLARAAAALPEGSFTGTAAWRGPSGASGTDAEVLP